MAKGEIEIPPACCTSLTSSVFWDCIHWKNNHLRDSESLPFYLFFSNVSLSETTKAGYHVPSAG